ncbi:MAG: acyl-CoA dehydrogenase [Leptospira sp.]|nr:acyl-CoA dehydrogenase [Leptospira sp.]
MESLYRSRKTELITKGLYDYLAGRDNYGQFQIKLFELAASDISIDLAVACMVEMNVSGTILSKADLEMKSRSLELLTGIPIHIFATGISEPAWGGSLKKISSHVKDSYLFGTKSFITNGDIADTILWVTKNENCFPVYKVDSNLIAHYGKIEAITTNFSTGVRHVRVKLDGYPITSQDLILANYGNLSIEIRLKELYSLCTILLAFTSHLKDRSITIESEWKELFNFWKQSNDTLESNSVNDTLKKIFPFPVKGLLNAIADFNGLKSITELKTVDPDFQLFIWEDTLTKYLKRIKFSSL